MSVYFCSDLHLGHKNIHKFRPPFASAEDHHAFILEQWKNKITKRDDVYVLGDACFTTEAIDWVKELPGTKHLIRGNHDLCDTSYYLKAFKNVYGLLKYKEFWLSHAPIHPTELRGRVNLHGHVHTKSVTVRVGTSGFFWTDLDSRYFNCCVENTMKHFNSVFVELDQLRKHLSERTHI